jgi:uncharacterized OB-fold protein
MHMSILEKVDKNINSRRIEGEIPIQSRYTYGLAGERFFREIMDKARLLGTYCERCDYIYVPPTIFCERCLSKLEEWVEVGPEGTVLSFTVLLEALDGSPLDEPEIMALIQLDGANSMFVHRLGEVRLEDQLAIGMRVKAVFKPKKQREGSVLDISHFAPVED